ncbi:hypothetical protein Tco_0755535 [Tanacetum coccineum]
MEKCLSLTDVMVPLTEPLSSRSLIGEASTYVILVAAEPVTTLFYYLCVLWCCSPSLRIRLSSLECGTAS